MSEKEVENQKWKQQHALLGAVYQTSRAYFVKRSEISVGIIGANKD